MKKEDLKNSSVQESNMEHDLLEHSDEKNSMSNHTLINKRRTLIILLIIFILLGTTIVYASSSDFRNGLAAWLNIEESKTHFIDESYNDGNITMTAVSSHVVNKTATVMVIFTKNNGEPFKNRLAPGITSVQIDSNSGDVLSQCEIGDLSEDNKTVECYLSYSFKNNITQSILNLSISDLICIDSMVGRTDYEEIKGEWKLDIELSADEDNSLVIENPTPQATISMCGKTFELGNIIIVDNAIIAENEKVLEDKGMPDDPLSSVGTFIGAYYGIFVTLDYADGTTERLDCRLDSDGNIIAYCYTPINKDDLSKIKIGDIEYVVQ